MAPNLSHKPGHFSWLTLSKQSVIVVLVRWSVLQQVTHSAAKLRYRTLFYFLIKVQVDDSWCCNTWNRLFTQFELLAAIEMFFFPQSLLQSLFSFFFLPRFLKICLIFWQIFYFLFDFSFLVTSLSCMFVFLLRALWVCYVKFYISLFKLPLALCHPILPLMSSYSSVEVKFMHHHCMTQTLWIIFQGCDTLGISRFNLIVILRIMLCDSILFLIDWMNKEGTFFTAFLIFHVFFLVSYMKHE